MPKGGPHFHGVALILSSKTVESLLEFRPRNEVPLTGKHGSMTVVQCYAPIKNYSEDEKDQFNYSFKTVVEAVPTIHLHPLFGRVRVWVGLPEKIW